MPTLYDILGVPVNASQKEVQDAYRQLLLRFHPDRCYHDNDSAVYNPSADVDEVRMQVLEKVADILSNPKKRHLYDAYLMHKQRSDALIFPLSSPMQWYSSSTSSAILKDDVLSFMVKLLPDVFASPASSRLKLPSGTPHGQEASPEEQPPQQPAPTTQTSNTPGAKPMVYAAAINVRHLPDGTVVVRSYKSGPPATSTPLSTTSTTSTAAVADPHVPASKEELPRRVRVMEEQLGNGDTTSNDESVEDDFSKAIDALTNYAVSLVSEIAGEQ
ncbi:hypothetical protein ABL78_0205 [Leptomonas seymouri]|uniref:J domain-containing protein n=1 Tax=Leptomonas seymouri TaxID=5684 RepID=A0A0N0P924_LEPSE|nr:hypothetical protein ABL78_0205 [Leptomonas seymouri]|eukprot:KPI90609.1 hypothetical protein ABL78_0205 [Leptomonas seymouri]